MFFSNGYVFHKRYGAGHNYARLYKKVGSNPLNGILMPELIRKHVQGDIPMEPRKEVGIRILTENDKPQLNDPNPDEIKIEEIYANALQNIPPGEKFAHEYHHLISAILTRLFVPPLSNPKVEHKIIDG